MKILRLDYVVTHYGLSKSPPPLGLFPLPIVTSPGVLLVCAWVLGALYG